MGEPFRVNAQYGFQALRNEPPMFKIEFVEPDPAEITRQRLKQAGIAALYLFAASVAIVGASLALFVAGAGQLSFIAGILIGMFTYGHWATRY